MNGLGLLTTCAQIQVLFDVARSNATDNTQSTLHKSGREPFRHNVRYSPKSRL